MANNNNNQPVHLTAPYNFVPLNEYVYIPEWADTVSQDIPFADGEDGIIEVTWRNVSPLCIRDAGEADRTNGSDNSPHYSMHVKQPDGSRLYYLPGSSIRGMLRNTLNIMSFGKMTQYDNKYFGYRSFDTKKSNGNEYQELMKKASCGWLRYDKEADEYLLYPCKGRLEKKSVDEVRKKLPKYDEEKSAWRRNEIIGKNTFPAVEKNGQDYALFATGKMDGKKHELLIPSECVDTAVVFKNDDKVIKSFFTVYENTPDFDNYKKMLRSGEDIPVSFVRERGEILAMGMGRMFRYPYKYGIRDLVEKGQTLKQYGESHDLCEAIFGWTDTKGSKKESMKGRVQFGNAFASAPLKDEQLPEAVTGILGSPKPSFYPLYIEQKGGVYKNYSSDDAQIGGRKLYRIHKGSSVTELPKGNGNEKVQSKFRPIPEDQAFTMRIVVHNLKKVEIGALLSAITFHNNKDVWHNIGTAKGYGYGKLKCTEIKLQGFSHEEQEYLKAFESEMSVFVYEKHNRLWTQTEQIKKLLAIMSEHDDGELRMLEMDKGKSPLGKNEYNYFSQNSHFETLTEMDKYFAPSVSIEQVEAIIEERRRLKELQKQEEELRRIEQRRSEDNAKIDKYIQDNLFDKALDILSSLIEELKSKKMDSSAEEEKLENLRLKMQEAENAEKEKKTKGIIDLGFEANIDVDKWKTCSDKIQKWLKTNNRPLLTEEEKTLLKQKIRNLFDNPDKKEKRDWDKPYDKSSIWRKVKDYLGDDGAKALYDELAGI